MPSQEKSVNFVGYPNARLDDFSFDAFTNSATFVVATRARSMKNVSKSRVLLIAGIAVLASGLLLLAAGLDGLRAPVPCAINGCPSIFSETYAQYWNEIYAGVALIVVGIILILASTKIKSRLETNPSTTTNPS